MSGPTPHSHASNPERIPAVEIKNDIKIKAAISNEAASSIIHSSLRSLPLTAVSSLPSSDSLARTVRRQRPTLSLTSSSQLPIELRKTDRGDDFILCEDNEMIIFTTKRNLSLLKECTHWFVDGTFKVCPKQFYQLFTLHALLKSVVIPLVYGLLIGKSGDDYKQFFEKVLEQDDFQPESILSDFESGTIKTIKELFPNTVHRGCLFHYGQCIWRHIQENGLSTKYDDDDNFRLNVRKLLSLPFVPASEVIEAFELIADEFDDEADTLVEYYEKTWIGEKKKRGAGRKKPKFNNELWNLYERVINHLPRSNNSTDPAAILFHFKASDGFSSNSLFHIHSIQLYSMSLVRVKSQFCRGIAQYDRCSLNSACACFHIPGAIDVGICTDEFVDCSELVACKSSNNHCFEPNHECVHHPRCHNLPVCYPVPSFNQQFCPPIAMANTTTTIPTTTKTTTAIPTTTTTTIQQLVIPNIPEKAP
ncbi:unnamed protein product [Rotaria sordida]|uniref:MULE transposase domain-containing protein n=1 Tax=Rotaria sordida TaxID=392033 RepID=A0A815ESK1_9BILA|nr:unnamed protein product [Rotaria sordida]CAF1582231.1 unnamed protein product [Rotaria sordida]